MDSPIDVLRTAPGAFEALRRPGEYVARKSDLEPELLTLVRTYVSHLNGCRDCAQRHAERARSVGEEPLRLQMLPYWRSAPEAVFTPRERAALAWTELVTRVRGRSNREELFRDAREHFSEREVIDLTVAVISANGLDRFALALGRPAEPLRRPGPFRVRREEEEICYLCGTPGES